MGGMVVRGMGRCGGGGGGVGVWGGRDVGAAGSRSTSALQI